MLTLGFVQSLNTQVLMPCFDPGLQLQLIETYRGSMFGGVPTMLTALLEHSSITERDMSSLRYALSGGATVPAGLVRRVESAFRIPFITTFAQTESSCSITVTRRNDTRADRAETLGRPLPQTEVRIADPVTGATVAPGVIGEICTRGYHVMQGYLDDPAATHEAIDADGWLHTGDLGGQPGHGGRTGSLAVRGLPVRGRRCG